ncbi:hypothetical protein HMPREF9372_0226 [Sporosarcina newyorkensis 2681]|uniref:Uncharacterized protein n=1 Tax=Sporosarcina newyorkensis 2681 TaxID=1027292 RepID=F9DN46_9BACL|nr:hypothetical protein HMPREF9372_0226 [Sporosarcina newyorkensis 2681]
MARLAAFIVLLIPGIAAALGIKLMRDSLQDFCCDAIGETAEWLTDLKKT